MQVPDLGNRFEGYQIVDLRTDRFADLGAMYSESNRSTPPVLHAPEAPASNPAHLLRLHGGIVGDSTGFEGNRHIERGAAYAPTKCRDGIG